jgi:hypothetical protein
MRSCAPELESLGSREELAWRISLPSVELRPCGDKRRNEVDICCPLTSCIAKTH